MNCNKYILTNTGSTIVNFNYRRCDDTMWEYQVELQPNQTKNIWLIEGTYSTAFYDLIYLVDEGLFPPTPMPTPTPTPTFIPTNTPTPTPTVTPTPSMGQTILDAILQSEVNEYISIDNNSYLKFVDPVMMSYQLGRNVVIDNRDNNYLISQLLPQKVTSITSKYWQDDIWSGDQGKTPMCVGYAWAHFIEDGPITHSGVHPLVSPVTIYKEAQKVDEWPGENYNGTSVRAGAKYLLSSNKISSYLWAFEINTLINTVLNVGPVVVGSNWYNGMFNPDRNGLIKISGSIAGGHAYVINGIDTNSKLFRIKNSWGKSWGQGGHAYISFADMTRLIKENGEVCLAVENKF